MSAKDKKAVVIFAFLILFLMISCSQGDPFVEQRDHYMTLCQKATSLPRSVYNSHKYKLVVIDAQSGDFHRHRFTAKDPEDATALVCVTKRRLRVGIYTDGAEAFRIIYKVLLIDLQEETLIAERELRGADPPERKYTVFGQDMSGSSPDREFDQWLEHFGVANSQ